MRSLTVLTLCLLAVWTYGATIIGHQDLPILSPIRVARDASAHVDSSTPSGHADPHDDGHHGNNTDDDGDGHPGNDTHHGGGHRGVHVASWQFNYVRAPLTICIILIVTAVCKLGKSNWYTFHSPLIVGPMHIHPKKLSSIVPYGARPSTGSALITELSVFHP